MEVSPAWDKRFRLLTRSADEQAAWCPEGTLNKLCGAAWRFLGSMSVSECPLGGSPD